MFITLIEVHPGFYSDIQGWTKLEEQPESGVSTLNYKIEPGGAKEFGPGTLDP